MKKVMSILLSLCMLLLVLPTASLAEEYPNLKLVATNISLRNSVQMVYAYHSDNDANVEMLVWSEPQSEYTYANAEKKISPTGAKTTVSGVECSLFYYTDLAARQMTDVVYTCAYTKIDGQDYYSEVAKLSILDYAFDKLGRGDPSKESNSENFKNLLNAMLAYGSMAQLNFEYKTDKLANADYIRVNVENGTLSDGFPSGLYISGTDIQLNASETNEAGESFNHWKNSAGVSVATTAQATVQAGSANETYIAVYGGDAPQPSKPTPSTGLGISAEGDEAVIDGLDDCSDSFVVLPDTYENCPVTEIGASAFANGGFAAIYIPKSITTIGRRAFSNCVNLTDVYYEGTEADWNKIAIGTNNTPLTTAEIHFSSYGPQPSVKYTVTFKDYDGTILHTENVNAGENATPPAEPSREGCVFVSWNGCYTNVQENSIVTAQYEEVTDPIIVVSDAVARAGDLVDVKISLKNNPGVAATILKVSYDDSALTLDHFAYGNKFQKDGEEPASLTSPVTLTWSSGNGNISGDETYAVLTFKVADNAAAGNAGVSVSYDSGNVANFEEEDVDFQIRDGAITIR